MSEIRSLRLVCTGRAKPHPTKPRLMLVWRLSADEAGLAGLTVDTFAPTAGSWLEFDPCSVCGFAPRIGHDTIRAELADALEQLKGGAWSVTLDISTLNI